VRYALVSPDKLQRDIQVDDGRCAGLLQVAPCAIHDTGIAKLQYAELRLDQLAAQVTPGEEELRRLREEQRRYNEPRSVTGGTSSSLFGRTTRTARKLAGRTCSRRPRRQGFRGARQASTPGSGVRGQRWRSRLGRRQTSLFRPVRRCPVRMNVEEIRGPVKTHSAIQ